MTAMQLGEVIGLVAGGVGVTQGLPQALRVRALGHGTGVSVAAWLLMFTANSWWTGYGLCIGAAAVVIANVLTGIISASVVVAVRSDTARTVPALAAAGVALAAFGRWAPLALTTVVLLSLTASRVPQLWRSLTRRRSGQASAVSFTSLAITAASLVLWFVYSLVQHRRLVTITSLLALTITTGIAAAEAVNARRAAPAGIVPVPAD